MAVFAAEVGYIRQIGDHEYLDVIGGENWCPRLSEKKGDHLPFPENKSEVSRLRGEFEAEYGTVAKRKHRDHCNAPFKLGGGPRHPSLNDHVRRHTHSDGSPYYTEAELRHFAWLGSEGFIPLGIQQDEAPLAVLVLGHHAPDHFSSQEQFDLFQEFGPIFDALFRLCDLMNDRDENDILLIQIAEVLPLIAAAKDRRAFERAILTLLTCGKGFRFDRAMFFWMLNDDFPATCEMALGGTNMSWSSERLRSTAAMKDFSLKDYIRYVLRYPVPGEGPHDVPDPLYQLLCGTNVSSAPLDCFSGMAMSARFTTY